MRAIRRLEIGKVCAFAVMTIAPMVQLCRAGIIHESATLGPTGQGGGWGLDSTQFIGSRFYVDRPVDVTSIGGHLVEWGGGDFFGAIVYLSSWSGLPLGSPFAWGEVAASTVFDPGSPSSDFRTPLSVTLSPGFYVLIFGTGALGSHNGEGAMPYQGQTDRPGASYILWEGSNWWESLPCQARFVVEGTYSGYCPASGSSAGEYDYIGGVRLGSIDNWGTGNSHYGDYTSMSTTIVPNREYTLLVHIEDADEYSHCCAWIDWNQDMDFADAAEQLTVSEVSGGYCTATVILPDGAVAGDTGMRVRLRDTAQGAREPCGHAEYGEVEDYTITVGPAGPQTRIYGKKWHDLNDNGEMDGDEPALSGWSIFLDENHNGEIDPNDIVTTTDIQGNYEFAGMEPNERYNVSEADQAGWMNTYPGAGGIHFGIWVDENNDVELNFGNYQLHNGDISGYKFHDVNNNGVWDDGEEPLIGWEIYIDESENGRWDAGEPKTTTNASGYYEFTNRGPGYYNVMEAPKAGWLQTYPGPTSGRLWGLEKGDDGSTSIAELNLETMTIENRFTAPHNMIFLGGGWLAAGPGSLFYCPLETTGIEKPNTLFFEIDSETGGVINQGVLEVPEDELIWDCAWHNGILYINSVVVPLPPPGEPAETYLNRYDPFTGELVGRDQFIDVVSDALAGDPYEDLLLCHRFATLSLYEIDPHTANVVGTIRQQLVIGAEMAYTNGVLHRLLWGSNSDDIHIFHREDGSLISTQQMTNYRGFETITGGIGVKGGHRVWIGKRDVEANFGSSNESEGALSGVKYEDLNGNGERDESEPGLAGWTIYVDLDGDMHPDAGEPTTVTDENGNWIIDGLVHGRYFVREVQKKGYYSTEPKLGWIDTLDVLQPRDIIFDDMRNRLYISTGAGEIERFDLSTNEFLSPVTVGGSPHGIDISADYSDLYVADTQLMHGNGIVHVVDLDSLGVGNMAYTVQEGEEGSYDIAIGSEGVALFTGSSSDWNLVPLYVWDRDRFILTAHPNIMGANRVREDLRLIRSHDRSRMLLVGNSSSGWVAAYDVASNSFISEKRFSNYLHESPIALNYDGSLAAVQLYEHCRIVDSDFNMVMGLDDSRMGAEFDPSSHLYYQFHREWNALLAIDTAAWEVSDHVGTGLVAETYEKFVRGETAITSDGRILAITDPNHVALHRREYYTLALPGRTISGLDFGNKPVLCGDIDRDRDIDFKDVKVLADEWLLEGMIYDSDVAGTNGPDGHVNLQDFACLAGNWGVAEYMTGYDEDFETGGFSNLPWVHAGYAPWTIDFSTYFEGDYSAKSADMPRYKESILSVTAACGEGNVYFMLKSGRGGLLTFRVDGEWMFSSYASAGEKDLDWSLITVPVSAGTHTFEWNYEPDGYGEDHAWIDAIRFPPAND